MPMAISRAVEATQHLTRSVFHSLTEKRQKAVVAVEWGGEWLKIAQVAAHGRERQLVRLEARRINSPDELPKILRELLRDGMEHTDPLMISLPRNLVTVRNLKLPTTDPIELKEMISLQAARQTPYSKEEVITNFQQIRTGKEGFTDVILVIANREISQERLKVLEDAHLKVAEIRLSSQGVLNWQQMKQGSSAKGKDGPVAVIDIDSNFTDFVVVSKGQLIFTKVMPIGAGKLLEGQEKWEERFAQEMKAALDLYEHEGVGGAITQVVITGIEIEPVGPEQFLREKFDLMMERTSLFDKVPGAQLTQAYTEMKNRSTSFTAVVGLAWNPERAGLDLIPWEVRLKEGLAKRGRDLMIMGGLLLSILMVFSGLMSERLYFKRQYLEQLKQEVLRTNEQAREVERLRKEIKVVKEIRAIRNSTIELLSRLQQLLPREIYLTAITFKEGEQLTLTGVSEEMSDVFRFAAVLEKQPGFEPVKIKQVTKRVTEGESERTDFEIVCFLTTKNEAQGISF